MVMALLALLGIPLWFILGLLLGSLWSRRRFQKQPEVFQLKLRDAADDDWPRTSHGRIIHDVLVINSGLALVQTEVHGVKSVAELPSTEAVKSFDNPHLYELAFGDGSMKIMAVDEPDAPRVVAMGHLRTAS